METSCAIHWIEIYPLDNAIEQQGSENYASDEMTIYDEMCNSFFPFRWTGLAILEKVLLTL